MHDLPVAPAPPHHIDARAVAALARAAAATARLDQTLGSHPLLPAFLHRVRLDAVRRQAAVDGRAIEPWHLAATIEGLRLRLDGALRTIDRGTILDAARHALALHQWLVEPDFDQEGEVQRAGNVLDAQAAPTPLLAAAAGVQVWIQAGEARAPMRAALVRFWTRARLLRAPVPLTGAAAFRAAADGAPEAWTPGAWTGTFLEAVAGEAETWLDLLFDMDRTWQAARAAVAGRRRISRAVLAVDVMAATPLVSATTLARALAMSIKNAGGLLDRFRADEIAVEVTHRSARRLFGLAGLAPLRDIVAPPRRPQPGRGRGRPPLRESQDPAPWAPPALPPVTATEHRPIDFTALEAAMAHTDDVIRQARRSLDALRQAECQAGAQVLTKPLASTGGGQPGPERGVP